MLGRVVGNYRIVEKIGEGGMGAVYRAVDEMLEREVAIKAIRPDLAREPQIVERFRAEAKILARVSHPSIAGIYSFFYDGGELFLAMELVRGRTLSEVIEGQGALPWQRAVPLFSTALEGIEQAHRAGIIHRDLKPDNLMLTEAGTLKVMDFGIARMAGSSHLTRTGLLVGTLRYIAPEQIRGEEVDQRTDIYALGAVLYQMLTGRVPFDGPTDFAILKAQLDDPPVPPGSIVPDIPAWLDRAVLKALEKDPAARFQTVEEMRLYLNRPGTAVPETRQQTLEEFPTLILPPKANPTPAPAAAASPATIETDRTRLPPLPSLPTNIAAAPSTSYRPVETPKGKKGWMVAVLAAVFVAVLTAGAFLWNRRGPAEPVPAEATPIPSAAVPTQAVAPPSPAVTAEPLTTVAAAPAPVSQPPRPVPSETRSQEMPKPAAPPPSSRPEPAPSVSEETPAKAPEPSAPAAEEPEPEPVPSVPSTGELPYDELRRVSEELVAASEKLGETYDNFLEQKEDGGAELTETDEELRSGLETLTDAADRLNKRFKEGFFTRGRLRSPQNRTEIANRFRALADTAGQVDRLVAQVQPGPEVRQDWKEVRRRWVRIGEILRGR
ncbi:MAG TPA: protein kinase [Thermoanaerobaculia bacterium]|jgi:serine/threonine-protein kinase|nr:protein kinase [Thermoanaerobaculia bacterium]